jgi:uncharacterized protein YecE (DUF72 family)
LPVLIGTSGWHYRHWKGLFYPAELPAGRWLTYYAERFDTVELNNAFYRLPEERTFRGWAEAVPERFTLAVKASRYLTHIKRLRDPAEPVSRLMERARHLGDRLGPILLQLPPDMRADTDLLAVALDHFPPSVRVAVEARHPSWFDDATAQVLSAHDAAWCLASGGREEPPRWRTTGWGYIRFHRGRGRPDGCYRGDALDTWAATAARLWTAEEDVYCYFNNDGHGCAPRDARRWASAVASHGLLPSRVPGRRETPVR